MAKYLAGSKIRKGMRIGTVLRTYRSKNEYSIRELGLYLSTFWNRKPSTMIGLINSLELGGRIAADITGENPHRGETLERISDYASALEISAKDKLKISRLVSEISKNQSTLPDSKIQPYSEVRDEYLNAVGLVGKFQKNSLRRLATKKRLRKSSRSKI